MKKLRFFLLGAASTLMLSLTLPDYIGRIHNRLGGERYINEQRYYREILWEYYRSRNNTVKDSTIIFFGDSRINAVSVESNLDAVNYGISGETLFTAVKEIAKFNNLEGKRVVLGYGINDNYRDPVDVFNDFLEVMEHLKGSDVYVLEVLPTDGKVERFDNKKVEELNGLLYTLPNFVPLDGLHESGILQHTYDGVHLDEKGNAIFLKKLVDLFGNQ